MFYDMLRVSLDVLCTARIGREVAPYRHADATLSPIVAGHALQSLSRGRVRGQEA